MKHSLWVSAAFIPGKENKTADAMSRVLRDDTEWQLSKSYFREICQSFGVPEIDLFASRLNKQIDCYVSWRPEPEAFAVDAFSINWSGKFMYMFSPFSIIGQVIVKVHREKVHCVMVIPDWPGQPWYPQALQLACNQLTFPPRKDMLRLPHALEKNHPLCNKLQLLILHII